MLFIFHGSDRQSSFRAFRSLLRSLSGKRPEASVFWFDDLDFDPEKFREILVSRSLFYGQHLVAGRRLLADPEIRAFLFENRQTLKESEHIFLLWEEDLKTEKVGDLLEVAEQVKDHSLPRQIKREEFNVFSLSDALGSRDRKKLWLLLVEAKLNGLPAEKIYWRLFDQVKKMILIKSASDPGFLTKPPFGFKPFFVKKLKTSADNYDLRELQELAAELFRIFCLAREGRKDLFVGLESVVMRL